MTGKDAPAGPAPGRPRDLDIDRRILAAATRLFGRVGWSGFTFEAVAREAGVGKPSLYLRWQTKEQLLSAALAAGITDIRDIDTGDLRGDLRELGRQLSALRLGPDRRAVERMGVEARDIPEVAERWDHLRESQVHAARAMVHRAIDRGELPARTSVTLFLDTFIGAITMHATSTPERLKPEVAAGIDTYVEDLIGFLLGALAARS